MQADYAIELGADDEVLELPWSAPGQGLEYFDLKERPELLQYVEEARRIPEMGQFLSAINSPGTNFQTAKCDVWASREMNAEEEIFRAGVKFVSYVDLIFSEKPRRFSFPDHERVAKDVSAALTGSQDIPAAAEFLIRRCYYHEPNHAAEAGNEGFYFTFYLSGYDEDEDRARQQWAAGLNLSRKALLEVP